MISLRGDHQDSDKHLVFYVPVEGWQEKRLPASFVLYRQLWPFQLAHPLTNMTAFLSQNQEWFWFKNAHKLHFCLLGSLEWERTVQSVWRRLFDVGCVSYHGSLWWSHCARLSATWKKGCLWIAFVHMAECNVQCHAYIMVVWLEMHENEITVAIHNN